jgi:hypothetical protein
MSKARKTTRLCLLGNWILEIGDWIFAFQYSLPYRLSRNMRKSTRSLCPPVLPSTMRAAIPMSIGTPTERPS